MGFLQAFLINLRADGTGVLAIFAVAFALVVAPVNTLAASDEDEISFDLNDLPSVASHDSTTHPNDEYAGSELENALINNTALDLAAYQSEGPLAQSEYWALRIGLDPNVAGDSTGSIQAQLNWMKGEISRLDEGYRQATALAASLQDPYVPAGQTGSFSISSAGYDDKTAISFGLSSIVGTSGRFSLVAAFPGARENTKGMYRLGYTLSW